MALPRGRSSEEVSVGHTSHPWREARLDPDFADGSRPFGLEVKVVPLGLLRYDCPIKSGIVAESCGILIATNPNVEFHRVSN